MISGEFLYHLRPAMALIPNVEKPNQKMRFKDKLVWTGVTLFIYLVCCQIPIYGIMRTASADPFYWMRVILASNRGSLMELGISPLVTSSMIVELLVNTKILKIDRKVHQDAVLLKQAQKLLGIIITFASAVGYVYSGSYGEIQYIGYGNAMLIIAQLTFAGFIVLMLDEMMNEGWGLGSGISLFISTNICEHIVWRSFSPITIKTEAGIEFEGAIIAFFHLLFTKQNKLQAVYQSFTRVGAPNLNSLFATLLIFLIVIYFQGFKVDIPLISTQNRGFKTNYPIKLFYTSNIPIILMTALISNFYFISQLLYKRFKTNFIVKLLGVWQEYELGIGHSRPIGGLAYYLTPPRSVSDLIENPLHALFYIVFVLVVSALFSLFWLEISGKSPNDMLRNLVDNKLTIAGHRNESIKKILKRYIPIAAAFGGICIGLLTIFADLLGAIGSGTSILLAVNIIYSYFEMYKKEKQRGHGSGSELQFD